MLELFGRLHPVILHLPIGFLVIAFLMHFAKRDSLQPAIGFTLKWGFIAAIITAASGYFLSNEGGYNEDLLFWHKWLGIGTALFSGLLLYLFKSNSNAFSSVFIFSILLLLTTGHLGGSLTHGEGFLFEPFQKKETPPVIVNIDSAIVFQDFIQPILNEKCAGCHNESKLKGELLLTSEDGILHGGKSGALFTSGNLDNSLIFKRIHLPIEEKKHMPPKGKKQLTDEEIVLLKWWISNGADFKNEVAQINTPDSIRAILNKYIIPVREEGIFAVEVDFASERKIEELREIGFRITPIAEASPFLEAVFPKHIDLEKSTLKKLKSISDQLVYLDLSGSNVDDGMLSILPQLSHLNKLHLHQTNITDKGLRQLKGLDFLEYLNLYDTEISDEGLPFLANLPRLRQLYIWRTNTTEKGIAELQNKQSHLIIDAGADKDIFGDAKLVPPQIIADKDIFQDSLSVELQLNFKAANIYYTLDGSTPDTTSDKYENPILLHASAEIKTFAQKSGWISSDIATKVFPKAKYKAKEISISPQPNKAYKANGAASLIDFERGSLDFKDGKWLGFQKNHANILVDLGSVEELSRITVGILQATSAWVFYPKGLQVSVSENGTQYKEVIKNTYPTASTLSKPETSTISETFTPIQGRFLKIQVRNNVFNPDWHPAAGEPCWVFIDEVVIE